MWGNVGFGRRYDAGFFSALFAVENRHFWFLVRNTVIRRIAARVCAPFVARPTALEMGCGTGNVLRCLEGVLCEGVIVGMDLEPEALRLARIRTRAALVAADVTRLPFRRVSFALIGMFDVLEHIPDDEAALREIRECLAPGGRLILTVPAHPRLWSYFDVASGHCRRYRRRELYDKLRAAGYCVEFISGFMMLLLPLTWLWRKVLRRGARAAGNLNLHELAVQEFRVIPVLNGILEKLLKLEAWWVGSGRRLPSGTSWIAIARRCS